MPAQQPMPVYSISLPRDTKWDGRRTLQFVEQMLLGFHNLVFRIDATHDAIHWEIIDPVGQVSGALESAIRASYPDATIVASSSREKETCLQYPFSRVVLKYQYGVETFLAPLVYASEIKSPDPLSHVVEVMGNLREGEHITYYLFVAGSAPEAFKEGEKHLIDKIYDGSLIGFLAPYKVDHYTRDITRVLNEKWRKRLYHASLFIQLDAPDLERLAALAAIDSQMVGFARPMFGSLKWINDGQPQILTVTDDETAWQTSAVAQYQAIRSTEDTRFRKSPLKRWIDLILEPEEMATLWHLPHSEFTASTIQWSYRNVPLPAVLRGKSEGVCVGVNEFAGHKEPIYIPDRSGHISIIGQSGVGKSNLMHYLIHQDILAGRGVALIDPHGQLVTDILRYSIPPEREKDVIVLDLADENYPAPLNMLSVPDGIDRGNAAGQLMGVLDRLYSLSETPTVADTMWASLVTLFHDDQPTIRDVGRLFRDESYRTHLMNRLTNVAALEFWERFNEQKSGRDQAIRPVLWRLRALYGNSVLYPILCHPDTLDFASILAQKKILLVSLKADEARIPIREQYLLGLVLLTQLQQTIMARSDRPEMFYLYVDEVQHFVTTTFDTLLSEARKHHFSLTTANQYLRQLTGDTLNAILGNVGTMIAFQSGLDDARLLEPYFAPGFDAEHLMHLNKYEAAMTTRYRSQSLTAFSLKTLPPLQGKTPLQQAQQREMYLRRLSREQYTPKHRNEVLAWLAARYTPVRIADGVDDIVDFE